MLLGSTAFFTIDFNRIFTKYVFCKKLFILFANVTILTSYIFAYFSNMQLWKKWFSCVLYMHFGNRNFARRKRRFYTSTKSRFLTTISFYMQQNTRSLASFILRTWLNKQLYFEKIAKGLFHF